MLDVVNGTKTIDELGQEMLDSLKNSLIVSDSKVPFTTFLPVGVTLGGSYSLTKSFSAGLLSYSRIIGKQFRESLTLVRQSESRECIFNKFQLYYCQSPV